MRAEQVTAEIAYHGEGAVWDAATGRLLSVDMLDGDLLALDLGSGELHRTHVDCVLACVRPRRSGGYVLAVERGFGFLAAGSDAPELLQELWTNRGVRMNEGGCDPQGRFYSGSMAYDQQHGRGAIWRLDPDGRTTLVLGEVTVSNGLVWSADGATAYYVDSPTQRIDAIAFDAGAGALNERRPVARIAAEDGTPDGMTLDAEGGLWVALYGGGCVRRYTTDGELSAQVDVPSPQVTSCAFGGPDLDELYITTSREGQPRGERVPGAGAIYRASPGVRGVPVLPFTG